MLENIGFGHNWTLLSKVRKQRYRKDCIIIIIIIIIVIWRGAEGEFAIISVRL